MLCERTTDRFKSTWILQPPKETRSESKRLGFSALELDRGLDGHVRARGDSGVPEHCDSDKIFGLFSLSEKALRFSEESANVWDSPVLSRPSNLDQGGTEIQIGEARGSEFCKLPVV